MYILVSSNSMNVSFCKQDQTSSQIQNYDCLIFISPEMMLITPDAALYTFINQGALTVDSINDTDDMKAMDVSQ